MSSIPHLVLYVLVGHSDPLLSAARGVNGDFIELFPELPSLAQINTALTTYKSPSPAPTVSKDNYSKLILGEQIEMWTAEYKLIQVQFPNYNPATLKPTTDGNIQGTEGNTHEQ